MRRVHPWLRAKLTTLLQSGHLHVFVANALLQLLGFGSVLFVAKLLQPSDLAVIKTTQAYAAVLVTLAGFGLTTPVLLYCADREVDDADKWAILKLAIWRTVQAGAGLVLVVGIGVNFVVNVDPASAFAYQVYALALPALALTSLLFAYLQARQQFAALAKSQTATKLASIAAVIAATYFWGVAGFLIMTVLTVYLGLIPLLHIAWPAGAEARAASVPGDFYPRAIFTMVGTFITMLGQSSDFMMLDWLNVDRDIVGRYALASVFLLAMMTVTGSVQTVVTPQFTIYRRSPAEFRTYLRSWNRRMPLIGLTVAAGALAAAEILEHYFFGQKYAGFTLVLAVLSLKYLIWSNYAVLGAALLGLGVVRSGVVVAAMTTSLSFALGYVLGREWGVYGVAASQVAASGAALLAILWLVRHHSLREFA